MNLNPEFTRNLWLEYSAHRVILIVVVLASLFSFAKLVAPAPIADRLAMVMFLITTLLWGSQRAAEALHEELRERTWDTQRMSALSPWSMTWGKLFGATLMPWLAGSLCLAVYCFERRFASADSLFYLVTSCLCGALVAQGLGLIHALSDTRHVKQSRSRLATWAGLALILVGTVYVSNFYRGPDAFFWYTQVFDRECFVATSLFVFAVMIVFGAYRLMAEELAVATTPWAWLSFLMISSIYVAGFVVDAQASVLQNAVTFAAIGITVCLSATHIAAFALFRDPLSFRRLVNCAVTGRWRAFLEAMPVWLASLLFAVPLSFICIGFSTSALKTSSYTLPMGIVSLVLIVYTVRNLALLFYFGYGDKPQRVESTCLIALAGISWLLPSLLKSLGFIHLSWALRPPLWSQPGFSLFVVAVQAAIIGIVCFKRYRQRIAPRLIPTD